MKTTVDIAEPLLRRARLLSAQEGVTLRELVEEGLRLALAHRSKGAAFSLRDASVGGRGVQPGVDESDWSRIREMIYQGRGG